ncbi:MAG: hypothetical protein K2Q01_02050 [Rickettsiales bacterium]|nr:hypothetical protein [Rickettsiales bacterium]
MTSLKEKARKLLAETTHTYFLVTQPGEDEVDYYSLIVQVPRTHANAFQRAAAKTRFRADTYGKVVYYGAGLLSAAEARTMVESLGTVS